MGIFHLFSQLDTYPVLLWAWESVLDKVCTYLTSDGGLHADGRCSDFQNAVGDIKCLREEDGRSKFCENFGIPFTR